MSRSFEQTLRDFGFHCTPELGSYWIEDEQHNLYTYLEIDNGKWSYVKYDENDNILYQKVFDL